MDVPLAEDDHVVYLLASLSKSFDSLVTALKVSGIVGPRSKAESAR